MILVDLITATICFLSQCYPALVGQDTPVGQFELTHAQTDLPGYGGDILMFHEDETSVYGIHRRWDLIPAQHRAQRLRSNRSIDRRAVTNGCINVEPEVYDLLLDCCSNQTIIIK